MNNTYKVNQTRSDVVRATGRRYDHLVKALDKLPAEALHDLTRLIRDLKDEADREKRKRRRGQFWG